VRKIKNFKTMDNFIDTFTFVRKRYVYGAQNDPILSRLTDREKILSALNHGLLDMLRSLWNVIDLPCSKANIATAAYLAEPNYKSSQGSLQSKRAYLKIIISILFLCKTVGFDEEALASFEVEIPTAGVVGFNKTLKVFIENFARVLQNSASTTNNDSMIEAAHLIKNLYLATRYWFDANWVPKFLRQIPGVMKN
jgi:hypothetical protein